MKFSEIAVNQIDDFATTGTHVIRKPNISIEFPPDGRRARKVISRSNAKATGKYPSWKMGRMMHYESSHERNAFRLLDACPEVRLFREQPCRIRYVMDGVRQIHYPDILVKLPWGTELLEVKTAADAATPEVVQRTAFMEQSLPLLGFGYRLISAEQLAKSPRLDNVVKLLRSGRSPIPMLQQEQIRQIFKAHSNVCLGVFKPGAAGEKYYSQICRLILEGALGIDFDQPMVDESPIQSATDFNGGASWE